MTSTIPFLLLSVLLLLFLSASTTTVFADTAAVLSSKSSLLSSSSSSSFSTCSHLYQGLGIGGNRNLGESFKTNNLTACCMTCDAIEKCIAFTLNRDQGMCWLKGHLNAAVTHVNGVSGLKGGVPMPTPAPPAPPTPPPTTCTGRCPNILYLMSDDMRPQLGAYGHDYMHTPNLDKLASSGLQFDFAYTQFAYCAPSRNSFLSGRRPERTLALNFLRKFRDYHPEWTAMPEYFRRHGYFTSSAGKIYHDGMDDPESWTYPSNQTAWIGCGPGDFHGINGNYCALTNASKVPYTDEDLALAEGLKRLELAVASGKPWFVSIGVHRPHTNYRVPPGFTGPELYPAGASDVVRPPLHPGAPINAPFMSGNWQGGDINDPAHGCPDCIVPANRSVEYRRWYYAAVTWADYSLGRALDWLEQHAGAEVAANTITVFHRYVIFSLSLSLSLSLFIYICICIYIYYNYNYSLCPALFSCAQY